MAVVKRPRHDWEAARSRYVHGTESLRALARATGIPFGTLARRSQSESWHRDRLAFQAQLRKVSDEAKLSQRRGEWEAFRATLLEAAHNVGARLRDMAAESEETDPRNLERLMRAIRVAYDLVRDTLGIPEEALEPPQRLVITYTPLMYHYPRFRAAARALGVDPAEFIETIQTVEPTPEDTGEEGGSRLPVVLPPDLRGDPE